MPTDAPLIIAGMHRSGTSMIAKYLNTAGLKLGDSLLSANEHNPHGYFEDTEFVTLHGKILKDACKDGFKGWPDWGYTEDLKFDKSAIEKYRVEAKKLISKKSAASIWGWKDPRSTLLLDFWLDLLPNAKVLGIYRNPWEVKQSMVNLNSEVFSENPNYAYEIWALYNFKLLAFANQYPDKLILVNSNAFIQNPKKLTEVIQDKWDFKFDRNKVEDYSFYDSNLFSGLSNNEFITDFYNDNQKVELLDNLNLAGKLIADVKNSNINMELLSVVIPCYNQGEYLKDALNSLAVSRNKIQHTIVVNDGSTDQKTIEIIDNINDNSIQVINQLNKGLANARNTGISESNGKYILLLDADNKVDPNYVTEAIEIMEADKEIGMVYANPRFFHATSLMRTVGDFDIDNILCQNYIDACTIIRRKALEQTGGFDEKMPVQGYEDWELWINMYSKGWKFHHINKFLFDYRVKENSMVNTSNYPENRENNISYLFKKHQSIYRERMDKVFPKLMKNYANMEKLALERQLVIEEQAKTLSNYENNKVISAVKNNKALKTIIKLFSR